MVMAISWFTLISPQSDHLSIADYDDTAIGVGTLTWQDPVHSWKAGPGEVMTVENSFIYLHNYSLFLLFYNKVWPYISCRNINYKSREKIKFNNNILIFFQLHF